MKRLFLVAWDKIATIWSVPVRWLESLPKRPDYHARQALGQFLFLNLSRVGLVEHVYSLTLRDPAQALRPLRDGEWEDQNYQMLSCGYSSGNSFETLPLNLKPAKRYLLHLRVQSPRPTFANVTFVRTDLRVSGEDSQTFAVTTGDNRLTLDVSDPATLHKIVFCPGVHPGQYMIEEFSIVSFRLGFFPFRKLVYPTTCTNSIYQENGNRLIDPSAIESRQEFISSILRCMATKGKDETEARQSVPPQALERSLHTPLGDSRKHDKTGTLALSRKGDGASRPIKALLCSHNLDLEGAPLYLYDVAKGLKRAGFMEPVVLSPRDGTVATLYAQEAIPVELIAGKVASVAAYQKWLTDFRNLVTRSGIEVVLANTVLSWHVVCAASEFGIPCLWNIHESEGPDFFYGSMPFDLMKRAYASISGAQRVLYGSFSTAGAWKSFGFQHSSSVIHNALDPEDFRARAGMQTRGIARSTLGLHEDVLCLLMVGTVSPRKGQRDILEALERLPERMLSRLRCFIVGDWTHPYAIELHQRISTGPEILKNAITCLDVTSNIHLYLAASDVGICASRSECFPRTVLEYMAYGLPIISTQRSGLSEQIFQGINALVYEPGAVGDLADRIRSLFDDQELRRRLGANSLEVFQYLNRYEDMLSGYASAFEEAVSDRALSH